MTKLLLTASLVLFHFFAAAQVLRVKTTPTTIVQQIPGYGQVSFIATKSFNYTPSVPTNPPIPIDEDSTTEDPKLYRYADNITVNITMADGNFTNTSIGKVWTLRLSAPNALNIGFTFNQFNLSPAAELYVFNEARTILDSGIKKQHFTNASQPSIFPIKGNSAIIYIVEPNNFETFKSTIAIQNLELGFQEVADVGDNNSAGISGASLNCIPSIQCQRHKIPWARAVARMSYYGRTSTGTLINNENNNGRAYFLTAFHCIDVNDNKFIDPDELAALTRARFQFQFWKTYCSSPTNNQFIQFTGAVLRGKNKDSDGVLLELLNPPGVGDGVNYAGWNRQTNAPNDYYSYIIHHPDGQDMRITNTQKVKSWIWSPMYWTAKYSSGVVAPGSSGSALFNENGQVVGQLKGGWSSCDYTDFGDRYGKFHNTWDGAGLQHWLSPTQALQSTSTLMLSPLSISGSDYFNCSSPDNVYSVPNLLGCSYTWTHSPNLQIISGQNTATVTIRSISSLPSDNGWIQVTITDSKGRNRTATARIDVQLGIAPVGSVTFLNGVGSEGYFCSSNMGNGFEVSPSYENTSYEYRVRSWPSMQLIYTDPTAYAGPYVPVNYTGSPGWYILEVKANTSCGSTDWTSSEVEYVNCLVYPDGGRYFRINASPNPTMNDLFVRIDREKPEVAALDKNEELKIILYAFNTQQIIKQWTFKNDQPQFQLNVREVKAGQYILTVSKGKYKQSKQILIK